MLELTSGSMRPVSVTHRCDPSVCVAAKGEPLRARAFYPLPLLNLRRPLTESQQGCFTELEDFSTANRPRWSSHAAVHQTHSRYTQNDSSSANRLANSQGEKSVMRFTARLKWA